MTVHTKPGQVAEDGDAERKVPQPPIHIEERNFTLFDYLKTVMKAGGSDLHLQADSVPLIRVDGRARFLDCPPLSNEQIAEFVKMLIKDEEHAGILEHRGAVDVSRDARQQRPLSRQPFS